MLFFHPCLLLSEAVWKALLDYVKFMLKLYGGPMQHVRIERKDAAYY